ncbi:MAG TPA: glycosyltransferase family 1 protein, partial [Bacteroidota bacterium]|nr:glycosyltransferase family 1 protein [Bacteroidota bacterium]
AYKKFPQYVQPHVRAWDRHVARSLHRANAIIVPSEHTRGDVAELFNIDARKIHVVTLPPNPIFSPNGTGDEEVRARYGLNKPYILFVGTLEPRKNIPSLVRAYENFRKENADGPDIVLVGKEGWLAAETVSAIDSSPVRSSIKRLNYVSESELASLYRGAMFFVYPSFYEGYGFPVLEAMASGIPVISSAISSIPELTGDSGLMIDPASVGELAAAMTAYYRDGGMRSRNATRGLERVKQISAKNPAETVMNIYDSLG